jgi:hypothetical protein
MRSDGEIHEYVFMTLILVRLSLQISLTQRPERDDEAEQDQLEL